MPRYFFDVYDDEVCIDDEGIELSGAEVAREQAVLGARELICEQVRRGRISLQHRIEIRDGDRRLVLILPFSDVVAVEGSKEPGRGSRV